MCRVSALSPCLWLVGVGRNIEQGIKDGGAGTGTTRWACTIITGSMGSEEMGGGIAKRDIDCRVLATLSDRKRNTCTTPGSFVSVGSRAHAHPMPR